MSIETNEKTNLKFHSVCEDRQGELDLVGKYPFLAEPFHCDFNDRLFWSHLGNHMLNAADFHSNDRDFGMHYLMNIHRTWVLSRLTIEMEDVPKAYDRFTVETWVESAMRYFTHRCFHVEDQTTGKTLGYGRSIWAMIDTETRQPTNILEVRDGDIVKWANPDKACPIDKPSRVKISNEAERVASIQTGYTDVDVNGHINSIKYIEHILNLWSVEWYRQHTIKRLDVAYVAEAHGGDTLHFYREAQPKTDNFSVRITKDATDGSQEEVCRCALLFREKEA